MIRHKCRTSYCLAYLDEPGWCPAHKRETSEVKVARDSVYDQRNRDKEMKRFYASADWQRVRLAVLADEPLCRRCGRAVATTVHHTLPAKQLAPAERLNRQWLEPVCTPCHGQLESAAKGGEVYRYTDPLAASESA